MEKQQQTKRAKTIRVTQRTYLGDRMYGLVCPVCGAILAAWCDREIAPAFMDCDCQSRNAKD